MCLCVCLQQHVRRKIVKDFPFQNGKEAQQRLAENEIGSSVAEESEQQMRRESEMKNRGMNETERGGTNISILNRDRSTDDLGNENPGSATHNKLLANDQHAHR